MVGKLVKLTCVVNGTKCCVVKLQFEIMNYPILVDSVFLLLTPRSELARRPTIADCRVGTSTSTKGFRSAGCCR